MYAKNEWGENTKKFLFFKDEGNIHERGHGRNISDDRGYDANSDTTTVTSGTMKFAKQ